MISVVIILDSAKEERRVAAFASYHIAESMLYRWAEAGGYFWEVPVTSTDDGRTSAKFTSTDGMIKAAILEMPLVEVL